MNKQGRYIYKKEEENSGNLNCHLKTIFYIFLTLKTPDRMKSPK